LLPVFEFCETPKVRSAEHQRLVLSQLMLGNQPGGKNCISMNPEPGWLPM
jgi:hypothetical protein